MKRWTISFVLAVGMFLMETVALAQDEQYEQQGAKMEIPGDGERATNDELTKQRGIDPTEVEGPTYFLEKYKDPERARLERVMELEGRTFSRAKYERYRTQVGWGVTFILLGTVAAGVAVLNVVLILLDNLGSSFSTLGRDDAYYEKRRRIFERHRAVAITSSILAVAFVGAGAPMIILGQRGKRRQRLLKQKNAILGDQANVTVSISPLLDAKSGVGGFSLNASF